MRDIRSVSDWIGFVLCCLLSAVCSCLLCSVAYDKRLEGLEGMIKQLQERRRQKQEAAEQQRKLNEEAKARHEAEQKRKAQLAAEAAAEPLPTSAGDTDGMTWALPAEDAHSQAAAAGVSVSVRFAIASPLVADGVLVCCAYLLQFIEVVESETSKLGDLEQLARVVLAFRRHSR